MFIFDKHKLSFYISIFHVTTQLKYHVTFWVGSPHYDSGHYQDLGVVGLVNVVIKRFDLTLDLVIDVTL